MTEICDRTKMMAGRVSHSHNTPSVPARVVGLGCRLLPHAPVGLRRAHKLSLCRVAGKDVESKPVAVEYPQEDANGSGGFFPTRDPGSFPNVEVAKPSSEAPEEDEYDPLRDGPLRYLGYANECGEAFAAWLPPFGVPLSYAIAIGYVFTDTGDKFFKALKKAEKELGDIQDDNVDVGKLTKLLAGERALDTVVWQLLASVAIPGATIHMVVAATHALLNAGLRLDNPDDILPAAAAFFATLAATLNVPVDTISQVVEKSVPTFVGLAAIPFIVHPIDETVHAILNVSMRPFARQLLCQQGGSIAGLKMCECSKMEEDFPILDEDTNLVQAFRASFDEENKDY